MVTASIASSDWGEAANLFQRNRYFIGRSVVPPEICLRWRKKAVELSESCARAIQKQSQDHHALRYAVVTGEIIKVKWPELFEIYCHAGLKEWVKAVSGESAIFVSPHLESAININVLAHPGDVYRWHFDAVAYTVLLYLSDSEMEDGGALEFYPNVCQPITADSVSTAKVTYVPRAGDAILMDGTRCYHRVAPILRPHLRISIPMVYPSTAQHSRPADLDNYLYDQAA
jgi:hypothetical protein